MDLSGLTWTYQVFFKPVRSGKTTDVKPNRFKTDLPGFLQTCEVWKRKMTIGKYPKNNKKT
jgi:hypothetical protein